MPLLPLWAVGPVQSLIACTRVHFTLLTEYLTLCARCRINRCQIFRTCPNRTWGPPSLLYNGYRVFPGVKSGRGVTLTPHPLLVPWSRKGRAIPLHPLLAIRPVQSLSVCTRVHFTLLTEYLTLCARYRKNRCQIFRTCPDRPWGPPGLLYCGYPVFP